MKLLKAGAVASEVYAKVHAFVEGKSATLASALTKNFGFVVCSPSLISLSSAQTRPVSNTATTLLSSDLNAIAPLAKTW